MYLGLDALQGPPGIELPAIISILIRRFSNETHYVQKKGFLYITKDGKLTSPPRRPEP
jgi:hypothetical protein